MRSRWIALGAAAAWCAIVACSSPSSGDASRCPNDLPKSCPTPEPSYANDIVPLVKERCFPCHDTGGAAGPKFDYSTYAGVYQNRVNILNRVYACTMPPADAGQPTKTERETLLGWLVCKAPDN